MLVAALKKHIESLPPSDFRAVWKAIEKVQATLEDVGPLSVLVIEHARLKHMGQMSAPLIGYRLANDELQAQLADALRPAPKPRGKQKLGKKKSK